MVPAKVSQIIVLLFAIIPSQKTAKSIVKHLIKMGAIEKGVIAPAATFIRDGNRIVTEKEVLFLL